MIIVFEGLGRGRALPAMSGAGRFFGFSVKLFGGVFCAGLDPPSRRTGNSQVGPMADRPRRNEPKVAERGKPILGRPEGKKQAKKVATGSCNISVA